MNSIVFGFNIFSLNIRDLQLKNLGIGCSREIVHFSLKQIHENLRACAKSYIFISS